MAGVQTSSPTADPAIAGLMRTALRSWRVLVWVGIELVVGLVLVGLPLFGVVGYEHALAATPVASLVALHVGISLARLAARTPAPALARARDPSLLVFALWLRAAAIAAAVTLIPLLLAAVHGLWAPTCDWAFGVRAHLSMVTTSAIVFSGAGVAIGLGTAGARAWLSAVAAVVLVVAIIVDGLWRFYSEPPVFNYSPLLGYFPGNMYDEDIRLGAPLYWARLEQLVWVVAALSGLASLLDAPTLRPRWRLRRPAALRAGALALAIAGLAGGVTLHASAGRLGYAVDADDIRDELGGRYQTEHFVIHYAQTDDIIAHIALIAADHEYRLAQVAATLGLDDDDLAHLGTIHSYYFATAEQKAKLMGARQVEMAKPWLRDIYLHDEPFPHASLRHEIAHVVASRFGDPWFGVAASRIAGMPLLINPGLIEGLAVAVDWPGRAGDTLTPHQKVRALQRMGIEPRIGDVMSLGFLRLSSQRSYTTAGSFVRFLLESHGATALRKLYASGGDFEAAYGRTLSELEDEWRAMLATVPLSDDDVAMIEERFRVGGVFSRPCPHAVAARERDARTALGRGDRRRAVALLRQVCRDSRQDPSDRLQLAMVLAAGEPDEQAEARAIFEAIAGDAEHVTSTLRAAAISALADLDAGTGDLDAARRTLERAEPLPLDEDQARQLQAKLLALRHTGPAAAALAGYFFGAPDRDVLALATQVTTLEPQLGLGWYLRGLQRVARAEPGAVTDLELATRLGLPGRRFERYAARTLAVVAWKEGDRAAVAHAADLLDAAGRTETDALLAADWRDRLARSQPLFTSR